MATTTVSRQIDAPASAVFAVISDPSQYSAAVPHITKVEFLSEQRSGVGTRFRETRLMRGREGAATLEVKELEPNRSLRLVSDEGGTIWDSVFTVTEENGTTELTLVMDARPYRLLARLITPLMRGMLERAVSGDLDAVKEYCETTDTR